MRFRLEIECDNAAFTGQNGTPQACGTELARILRQQANELLGWTTALARAGGPVALLDHNGNRVGFARFEEGPE